MDIKRTKKTNVSMLIILAALVLQLVAGALPPQYAELAKQIAETLLMFGGGGGIVGLVAQKRKGQSILKH